MDKIAIITGSSRGIGKEIAKLLAKDGCKTVINYSKESSKKDAEEVCKEIRQNGGICEHFMADVSKFDEAQKLTEFCRNTFGEIDILVNNAGISMIKPLNDVSPEEWQKMIDNNLSSVYNCTKCVMDGMIAKKSGKIINIASMWGVCGASCEVPYSAAKAGVIGFTKALAKELAPSNINVNCISPGVIMTNMMDGFSKEELEEIKDGIPLLKFGRPSDIAEMCLFLASEKASYITGQNFNVDGGVNI